MNKSDIIYEVQHQNDNMYRADVAKVVNDTFECVRQALMRGENVAIGGLGTFEVQWKPEHQGFNPRKKEHVFVEGHRSLFFRQSKSIRDALRYGNSLDL